MPSLRVIITVDVLAAALALPSHAAETLPSTKSEHGDFEAMMEKLATAQIEFHNGRPEAIKSLWSHADDVKIAGGAGAPIEKGWERISRRLDWASAQFSHGTQTNERLVTKVSGDFAYVVQIEHIRFRVPGQTKNRRATTGLRTCFDANPASGASFTARPTRK